MGRPHSRHDDVRRHLRRALALSVLGTVCVAAVLQPISASAAPAPVATVALPPSDSAIVHCGTTIYSGRCTCRPRKPSPRRHSKSHIAGAPFPCESTTAYYLHLRSTARDDVAVIEQRLERIEKNTQPDGFWPRLGESTLFDLIASYLAHPVVDWALVPLGIVGGWLARRLGLRKLRHERAMSEAPDRGVSGRGWVLTGNWLMGMSAALLAVRLLGIRPGAVSVPSQAPPSVALVLQRLDAIEQRLSLLTPEKPWSPVEMVAALALLAIAVIVILALVSRAWHMTQTSLDTPSTAPSALPDRRFIPALVLALLLLLLPYPAQALILPFLVRYLLTALLDVLPLHPDGAVELFVRRHFALIGFFAVFGVWLGFFGTLKNLTEPVSDGVVEWLERSQQERGWMLRYGWRLLPGLLAFLTAIPTWRAIRKQLS